MTGPNRSLKEVRAAQLRARLLRHGVRQLVFATVFLVGGLSFALGPQPRAPSSMTWMVALTAISTFHFGMGIRVFARVKKRARRAWPVAVFLWALSMGTVLRYLVAAD